MHRRRPAALPDSVFFFFFRSLLNTKYYHLLVFVFVFLYNAITVFFF